MHRFTTVTGVYVPDVTAEVMRTIDRTTQEAFGIDLLQMMENAGRELAARLLPDLDRDASVTVVAGGGGNGGGGLACARRLHDRGVHVRVVLARPASRLVPATGHQLATLHALGVPIAGPDRVGPWVSEAAVTVDALIGYGLRSRPAPWMDHLIHAVNRCARSIVSLDVPSGLDATRGV
ncbi:MAG: NAD(P)H-hydrate epimerase, partial [Trueperaceae bacterium]